jgi:hypothetical protein
MMVPIVCDPCALKYDQKLALFIMIDNLIPEMYIVYLFHIYSTTSQSLRPLYQILNMNELKNDSNPSPRWGKGERLCHGGNPVRLQILGWGRGKGNIEYVRSSY